MTRYVVRRGLVSLVLIWLTATSLFLFIHVLPGDPADAILGGSETRQPTPAQLESIRERLGLNRPLYEQYVDYMTSLVQGDLGESFLTGRPVSQELRLRLGRTLQLIVPAIILSSVIGIAIGVVAAGVRGGWKDSSLSAVGILGHSLPAFVTGYLLILLFAIHFQFLPSSGYVEFSEDPRKYLTYLILPVATLTLGGIGPTMRMTRMTMVEQISQDYARTATAKGLSRRTVTYRHILRNALIPVTTVIGLQIGARIAGAVLVETIFNWPGLGTLLLSAVNNRDYPVIQGTILLTSVLFILTNFAIDMLYTVLDPRIRYV